MSSGTRCPERAAGETLGLSEGCVKKDIFLISGEEPTEPKDLAWTWSHSSTSPRWGPLEGLPPRYQSLRGVAFLLEAWGLGGGPGKNLLSKWFEHFQLCPVLSVQPLLVPSTLFVQSSTNPSSKAPLRDFSSFQLGDAVNLQEANNMDRRSMAKWWSQAGI